MNSFDPLAFLALDLLDLDLQRWREILFNGILTHHKWKLYTVHWNVWDKIKIFFYYEHKFLSNVQNNNVQNNNSVENAWKTRDDSGNTSHISYSNHAKDVL